MPLQGTALASITTLRVLLVSIGQKEKKAPDNPGAMAREMRSSEKKL